MYDFERFIWNATIRKSLNFAGATRVNAFGAACAPASRLFSRGRHGPGTRRRYVPLVVVIVQPMPAS
jgi:hypothetical protein